MEDNLSKSILSIRLLVLSKILKKRRIDVPETILLKFIIKYSDKEVLEHLDTLWGRLRARIGM